MLGKSGSAWSSVDAQFFSVSIYKVSKCMMPSVLKSVHIFESRVVYSSQEPGATINHQSL